MTASTIQRTGLRRCRLEHRGGRRGRSGSEKFHSPYSLRGDRFAPCVKIDSAIARERPSTQMAVQIVQGGPKVFRAGLAVNEADHTRSRVFQVRRQEVDTTFGPEGGADVFHDRRRTEGIMAAGLPAGEPGVSRQEGEGAVTPRIVHPRTVRTRCRIPREFVPFLKGKVLWQKHEEKAPKVGQRFSQRQDSLAEAVPGVASSEMKPARSVKCRMA